MAFNLGANPKSLIPDSPAIKRQKTTSGYTSTSNSTNNTGAYNSDADSGDDLFEGYIPDTPAKFETQPTQIIDRSVHPLSSPPFTPKTVVQVPASSPFTGRDSEISQPYHIAASRPIQNGILPPVRNHLASSMAPAGTAYRPPHGIVGKPTPSRTYITIDDDEDDGPQFQGGSSDDESNNRANIKPSTFAPRSAQSSFGAPLGRDVPKMANGIDRFKSIVANSAYNGPEQGKVFAGSVYDNRNRDSAVTMSSIASASKPRTSTDSMSSGYGSMKKPQVQMRPERARPIEDISLDDLSDQKLRANVARLRQIFPSATVLIARNALLVCKGSLDDAATMLAGGKPDPTVISDDEAQSSQPMKKPEPQMKRGLNAPLVSIRDKYSSTQALPPRKPAPVATPPPKPKKRLVQGRRNPSSPAIPAVSSPLKPQSSPAVSVNEYDSDSGVASATDEDPELEGRVLKYLNSCKASDLVELTNITKAAAETMISARPFRSLDAARNVSNATVLKSGKKSTKGPIGDKIVETAMQMFSGYEAIDTLVAECELLGKPLAAEMANWGFDVFGASKDGELEMTAFEDDVESQRDSGIGSPSSAAASTNGDDDIKTLSSTRRRGPVTFLKKPDFMAEDCMLKDYQVVGLNWLALMYRHKLSCILADEMGLGKTCQVIAFLSHLVETGINGPHLVICPGSTLENWLREIRKFAPNLIVEPYHGRIVFY
jgi:SWI/SNF-related matrix-associated actin-dependent regulator 1 of chromatin subfamily A